MKIKVHRFNNNGTTVIAQIDPNAPASERIFTAGRMRFRLDFGTVGKHKEDTVGGFLSMDYESRVRHIKNLKALHLEQCAKEISA